MMYNGFGKSLPQNAFVRKYLKDFPAMADVYIRSVPESLPYHDFILFHKTGSRTEYESGYFAHRKRMDVLVCEALRGRDECLPALEDILAAICEEYTWALPAHIPVNAQPEETVTRIDLFAAETAGALSEILMMLGDRLSPGICARIRYELRRRITEPYLRKRTVWGRSNWSAVCANGVLTAMLIPEVNSRIGEALPGIMDSLETFLASYAEDGCCTEGALYWSYGFGNFVYAASLLREYSGGKIDYFARTKVKRIAEFGFAVYCTENYTLPYSDGPHQLNFNIGLFHFLKKEYPGLPLADERFAAPFGEETRCRFADMIRNIFWYDPALEADGRHPARQDFTEAQWFIRRRENYIFSCKGGNNAEPHNHNDIGSFIVLKDGLFLLDDLGWPEYDKNYFASGHRYSDYICAASEGHSVPIPDGRGQQEGPERKAVVTENGESRITLDISGAYGVPGLKIVRTWELREDGVLIRDAVPGAWQVTERFVTRIEPVREGRGVRIGDAFLTPMYEAECLISSEEFTPRLVSHIGLSEKETAWLIDFIPVRMTEIRETVLRFE